MIRRLACLIVLLACSGVAMAAPASASAFAAAPAPGKVTALTPAQVPALVKPPAHGARIIMLWALECAYCEPNMQALARLQKSHPQALKLILVDTDDIDGHRAAIAKRLAAAGMQDYPARAYAAQAPEQINYLIDPDWGGETPRTLVIHADGSRQAISGELTPAQLRKITP